MNEIEIEGTSRENDDPTRKDKHFVGIYNNYVKQEVGIQSRKPQT